jgi:hypothetical protein
MQVVGHIILGPSTFLMPQSSRTLLIVHKRLQTRMLKIVVLYLVNGVKSVPNQHWSRPHIGDGGSA